MAMTESLWNKVKSQLYWSNIVKEGRRISANQPENIENFPIDFVVTWVDNQDAAWKSEKEHYEKIMGICQNLGDNGEERYRDWELFRYWFRAVETYAPWVRNVYLVTCGHVPQWLNADMPKLKVVKHSDFIPQSYLPTFSCNPIELNLHRIPGLSEHFVYFNDDFFLGGPVEPEDFFFNGQPNYPAIACPLRNEGNSAFSHMMFTVTGMINERYSPNVRQVICGHPEKWFADAYGDYYIENLTAAKLGYLPGMYFTHLATPFRKGDFEKTWEAFPDLMEETSKHKFRTAQDAIHFLITLQTIMEGDFHPVPFQHFGMHFWDPPKQLEEICTALREKQYRMICINDSPAVSGKDYLYLKQEIGKAMQEAFPEQSSFEKEACASSI